MEPWNDAKILPPPVQTFVSSTNSDAESLINSCKDIIRVLSKQSPLHSESAVMSRFIYKFDKKFRNDIGFQHLKKVNTALRKYLKLNFLKDVESFLTNVLSDDSEAYFPTRQMLQYLLVRLQTFSKIMVRVCTCSKQASVFYLDRVKRGESHWMSLMPYAVLSRVWSITSILLQHSCLWYTQLFAFTSKLKLKGLPFLSDSYKLPDNLGKWLEIDDLDDKGRFDWSENKCIEVIPILEEKDNEAFDIFQYVTDINESEDDVSSSQVDSSTLKQELLPISGKKILNVDSGQVVSRKTFEILTNIDTEKNNEIVKQESQNSGQSINKLSTSLESDVGHPISRQNYKMDKLHDVQKTKNQTHSPDTVTGKYTLKQFIENEENFRNEGKTQSLTSHLSFMQWQSLKRSLETLYESFSKNRKVQRKFQKLWKDKCLDYL